MDRRFAAVHAELAEIFDASAAASPPLPASGPARPASFKAASSHRGAAAAGIGAVLLLLGSAIVGLTWSHRNSAPSQAPVAPVQVQRAPIPAAPPLAATPGDVGSVPTVAAAPPHQPPQSVQARIAAPPSVATRSATVRRVKAQVAPPHATAPVVAEADVEQLPPPPEFDPVRDCSPPYEAWCLRDVTLAADHELRAAYAGAVQAKVERRTLKAVKHDWVRFRRQARKDPRALISGYAELTGRLRRATAQKAGSAGAQGSR